MPFFGGNNPYSHGNWVHAGGTPEFLWLTAIRDPVERNTAFLDAGLAWLASRTPGEILLLLLRKTFLFWTDFGARYPFSYAAMLPLSWLGMWLWRGDPRSRLLRGWTAYTFLVCLVFYADQRMRLPVEPFLVVFAAAAGTWCLRRLPDLRWRIAAAAGWIALHGALWLSLDSLRGGFHVL